MENQVRVGVAVIIKHENTVLLGKRKNAHGQDSWAFPGGHLEFGESIEDCACRETKEETGLVITNPSFAAVTNDIFSVENKHYITIFTVANYQGGEVEIKESDKCAGWQWFAWDDLPANLFLPIQNLQKTNFSP